MPTQIHAAGRLGAVSPGLAAALAEWAGITPTQVEEAVADYLAANPPTAAPDATSSVKGVVALTGDLGGTAAAPTVPGLASKVDKGSLVVNVKDYGAVGDGIADDTAAIQTAIDTATGQVLLLPPGTYRVKAANTAGACALTSFAKARRITGAGIGATIIRVDLSGTVGSGALAFTNAILSDLTVDGGFTPAVGQQDLYALVQANDNTIVKNCHILNARGSCVVTNGSNVIVKDNRLEKFGDHAFYTSGAISDASPFNIVSVSSRIVLEGNLITDDPTYHNVPGDPVRGAVKLRNNVTDMTISNNIIAGDQCVYLQADTRRAEALPRRITVANNILAATYSGVQITTSIDAVAGDTGLRASEVTISGNTITGPGSMEVGVILSRARAQINDNTIAVGNVGVSNVETGDIGPSVIVNNMIRGGVIGVYKPGRNTLISGNLFDSQSASGVHNQGTHVTMHSNVFRSCAKGISHRTTFINNDWTVIDGNTFIDNTLGLELEANGRTFSVTGNTFVNNTTSVTVANGTHFNTSKVSGNRVLSGSALPLTSTDSVGIIWDESIPATGALPTAISALRGRIIRVQGGTGVADQLYMCRKKADETYEWLQVTA